MDQDLRQAFINFINAVEWTGQGKLLANMQPEPMCPICKISQWQGGSHEHDCVLYLLKQELEYP